jgi:hypothetical protein
MNLGDRVIWLGAFNPDGSEKGGWAGNGRGVIASYEKARLHYEGASPGRPRTPNQEGEASRGPAIGILLDQGALNCAKKYDIWVRPSSTELIPDPNPVSEV